MANVEITITPEYLSEWDLWCGVREFIQNAIDSETEFNSTCDISFKDNTISLLNTGANLPHEALLFGHTTKAQRGDTIGKFGEGLKLGALVLTRLGLQVRIETQDEIWTPKITKSEHFNSQVLVFNIRKRRVVQPDPQVHVFIKGINEEDWKLIKSRFIKLSPPEKFIQTTYGKILLDPCNKGKIFVKGIFVQEDPKFRFGFDLERNVSIDRDRKLLNHWDMTWNIGYIMALAAGQDEVMREQVYGLMKEGSKEIEGVDSYKLGIGLVTKLENMFSTEYGEHAFPVTTSEEALKVSHFRKRGIVVTKELAEVLQSSMGTVSDLPQKVGFEVVKTYTEEELTEVQRTNWIDAQNLFLLSGFKLDETNLTVEIVDFIGPHLLGSCSVKEGKIILRLSIKKLDDKIDTLRTLIHEYAHIEGTDGEKDHIAQVEYIWSRIVEALNIRDRSINE